MISPETGASDVPRNLVEKRIDVAAASARIEGLQVTEATKSLIRDHAGGKLNSDEVVDSIIKTYAPGA